MAKEIERKFLVKNNAWKKLLKHSIEIKQGYLSKDPAVRIRLTPSNAKLTIKGKRKGMSRDEFEYKIPKKDANKLMKMTIKPIINKTRHVIIVDDILWEIDVFKGINKGFTLAEVELKSEKQKIDLPEWIGKEVTYDNRYSNTYISSHKVPRK